MHKAHSHPGGSRRRIAPLGSGVACAVALLASACAADDGIGNSDAALARECDPCGATADCEAPLRCVGRTCVRTADSDACSDLAPAGDGGGASMDREGEAEGEGEGEASPALIPHDDNLAYLGEGFGLEAELQSVELAGDLAYVCTGSMGLIVYDVSDPSAPERAFPTDQLFSVPGRMPLDGRFRRCQNLAVVDGQVYASARADSESPHSLLASISLGGPSEAQFDALLVSPDSLSGLAHHRGHLLAGMHGKGLAIFAAPSDGSLERVGAFSHGLSDVWNIEVVGDLALVADGRTGIKVLDVSDPARPRLLGAGETGGVARDLTPTEGTMVAVAAGPAGLQIWDFAEPTAPRRLGDHPTPFTALGVAFGAGHAFVADWTDLRAFDLADPTAPRLVAVETVHTSDVASRSLGVAARDDLVLVAEWNALVAHRFSPGVATPELSAFSCPLDLGRVEPGRARTRVLLLENEGTVPLRIGGGDAFAPTGGGSDAFAAEVAPTSLAPGERLSIEVTADVRDESPVRATLRLRTDDADEAAFECEVRANNRGANVGDPAGEFVLPDLAGNPQTLAGHAGEVIFLAWFASYCPACWPEMSDIETAVWQRFRGRGLKVYGVHAGRGDSQQNRRDFVEQFGLTFPILKDPYEYWRAFEHSDEGISAFPIEVLIDRQGIIRLASRRYNRTAVVEAIEAALAAE